MFAGCGYARPAHGDVDVRGTDWGQWMLLPLLLLCNATAWAVARSISPNSLYALATPEPADKLLDPDVRAPDVRQKAISQGQAAAMEVVGAGNPVLEDE